MATSAPWPGGLYVQLPDSVGDFGYFWAYDQNLWYRDLAGAGWTITTPPDDTRFEIATQIDVYNGAGTFLWNKPLAAKLVMLYLIAPGGGGAGGSSGGNQAGGGGSGGSYSELSIPAVSCPEQLSLEIGAVGIGGAEDIAGTDGGDVVVSNVSDGTSWLKAYGGFGGLISGGLSVGSSAPWGNIIAVSIPGGAGGNNADGSPPFSSSSLLLTLTSVPGSGGGGGGNNNNGGDGGSPSLRGGSVATGGSSGAIDGVDGVIRDVNDIVGGGGGAGGYALGHGGAGGTPGGGGGGGGNDGANGGVGGNGAEGRVVIISLF